jgi:release factor glutamine methyltransferase
MTDLANQRGAGADVYQPAEDTHLLADAAVEEIPARARVLDVGTGSGYVAATVRDETGADVVGVDLNPFALRQAADRGVPVVRGDLVAPFREDAFDVVVFNPPYLPRDEDAERDDWMEVALSGGETGREVVEDFFDSLGRVLAPEGFALVLVSTLTGVEEVVEYAGEQGFSAAAIREESFPFETLTVLKLRK